MAVYTFYYKTLPSVNNVTFTACVQFSAEGIYADVPTNVPIIEESSGICILLAIKVTTNRYSNGITEVMTNKQTKS